MEPSYAAAIENSLDARILLMKDGRIYFKHELYRRTIESSLSPLIRIALNKRILELFLESFENSNETERIIHHAKNANEYDIVVHYAPIAAKQAACIGAHIEASKLYFSAIEYYQGSDTCKLVDLYEPYAYECYLIGRIKEAIIYQGKSLSIWSEKRDIEETGNGFRFLSRLWWYDGNRKKAVMYANKAIETLNEQPSSAAKAMAYSNMSQLKMLSDETDECIFWGEKAIAMANELGNQEILAHALNNIGTTQIEFDMVKDKGVSLLQQSLDIALKNSYHEHAARAYVNLTANAVKVKDYVLGKKIMDEGIAYCGKRDLDAWTTYLVAFKGRLKLQTGYWDEAYTIADTLLKNEDQVTIVKIISIVVITTIKMRRGETDVLPMLIDARAMAYETMELQRIFPVFVALLEYEWLTGKQYLEDSSIDEVIEMIGHMGHYYEINEFAFWLLKARNKKITIRQSLDLYDVQDQKTAWKAAHLWEQLGGPYMQAITLFEGDDDDKRKAIEMVHALGAEAVYEKLKLEMRTSGIKNIPRGKRKTTQSNPANLTGRELDVLQLLKEGLQNKEIADRLFISAKTVDHHISSIFFKLDVNSRARAVHEAIQLGI